MQTKNLTQNTYPENRNSKNLTAMTMSTCQRRIIRTFAKRRNTLCSLNGNRLCCTASQGIDGDITKILLSWDKAS